MTTEPTTGRDEETWGAVGEPAIPPSERPAPPAVADNAGDECRDCGVSLGQPDELESGLCLQCLNGPIRPAVSPVGQAGHGGDHRCSGPGCWYTLPVVDGLVVSHSAPMTLDNCEGSGRPPLVPVGRAGEEELREAIGQTVLNAMLTSPHQPNSGNVALHVADELLSGPLAPLLDAGRQVQAVTEAVEKLNRLSDELWNDYKAGDPTGSRRGNQLVAGKVDGLDDALAAICRALASAPGDSRQT